MNKDKFLEQKAKDMSVSELAEAIKIKSVLRTEKEKMKVGDAVELIKSHYYYGIGDKFVIAKVDEIGDIYDKQNICVLHNKVKLVKESKAEWKDITKDCEFRVFSYPSGFHHIKIFHTGVHCGYLSRRNYSGVPIISVSDKDYFKIEIEPKGNDFKILKKSGG